jgi:hypothetical protein
LKILVYTFAKNIFTSYNPLPPPGKALNRVASYLVSSGHPSCAMIGFRASFNF